MILFEPRGRRPVLHTGGCCCGVGNEGRCPCRCVQLGQHAVWDAVSARSDLCLCCHITPHARLCVPALQATVA